LSARSFRGSNARYSLPTTRYSFSQVKVFAEVEFSRLIVVDQKLARAFGQHFPFMNEVCAIHDAQGFADVVIGDDDADAAPLELQDDFLNFRDRDRIDRGERL